MGGGDLMDVLTSGADWGWNAPTLLTLCWPCTLVDVLTLPPPPHPSLQCCSLADIAFGCSL